MLRNGLLLLTALLISACSKPTFHGNNIASDPSFIGLESQNSTTLSLASSADYPELQHDIDAILHAQPYDAPPPVSIQAPSTDITAVRNTDTNTTPHAENSPNRRAYAYLQALFRGDGEGAWRYATVLPNPKQSWWDSNTAKGALLMKAGSSEYFAAQKQGVSRIDIPETAPYGNDARLIAHITYGNGSRSNMNLRLINEGGQWLVAEE